jgi:hypothetical protein
VGTQATADAGGALDVEVGHGVLTDVDTHFAIGTERGGQARGELHGRRGGLTCVSDEIL